MNEGNAASHAALASQKKFNSRLVAPIVIGGRHQLTAGFYTFAGIKLYVGLLLLVAISLHSCQFDITRPILNQVGDVRLSRSTCKRA